MKFERIVPFLRWDLPIMSCGRIVSIVGVVEKESEKSDNIVLIYLIIGIKWSIIAIYLEI